MFQINLSRLKFWHTHLSYLNTNLFFVFVVFRKFGTTGKLDMNRLPLMYCTGRWLQLKMSEQEGKAGSGAWTTSSNFTLKFYDARSVPNFMRLSHLSSKYSEVPWSLANFMITLLFCSEYLCIYSVWTGIFSWIVIRN